MLVAPGEASVRDEHYGGPRPAPRRAVRPKTAAEKEFCALGPVAEAFITGAAAAGQHPAGRRSGRAEHAARRPRRPGVPRRAGPGGRVLPVAGRRRPLHPGRRRRGARAPAPAGDALVLDLPAVPVRPLADYAIGGAVMTAATAPPLAPDLAAGLRRLKLAAIRQLAPELLITAKTQRWAPEELLRTLIDAEITAREASNARTRMKTAAFPVIKTLDELDRAACSIPGPTLDYLASLEWITGRENSVPGRAGRHGQEPCPGRARRRRRPGRAQGPLLHRRRPDRDPLPRPGRQLRRPRHREPAPQRPDPGRRSRVRPARRHRSPAAVPVRLRCLRTPLPGHRQPLALRAWGRFLPEHTTAVSLLDRLLHHASVVVTAGDSYRMRQARARGGTTLKQKMNNPEGWGLLTGHQRGPELGR